MVRERRARPGIHHCMHDAEGRRQNSFIGRGIQQLQDAGLGVSCAYNRATCDSSSFARKAMACWGANTALSTVWLSRAHAKGRPGCRCSPRFRFLPAQSSY